MSVMDRPGATIVYEKHGTQGPPLLLLHGGCCSRSDWANQVAGMAARCRIATVDLRGHGESVVENDATCLVETHADDVIALVHELGWGPVTLVGHSLGCRVILEACRRSPQDVFALILVDGSYMAESDDDGSIEHHTQVQRAQEHGLGDGMRVMFEEMFVATTPAIVRQQVMRRLESTPESIFAVTLRSGVVWDAACLGDALDAIRVPTLAIQSTDVDANGVWRSFDAQDGRSSWLDLLAKRLPHFEATIVTGAGHFVMMERPSEVNDAIEQFVTSNDR